MITQLTDNQIWDKAHKGDPSILSDSRIGTLKNNFNWTPLHFLASKGVKEVLKHSGASKVRDDTGATPLHFLAHRGTKKVWFHPDFDKVKNKNGETPKDWWFIVGHKLPTCADFIE